MDEEQEDFSVSSRFQSFLITGVGRVIITRAVSLLYIVLLVRFVPKIFQDYMVVISNAQSIIIGVALFGMNYSLTQLNIADNYPSSRLYKITNTVLIAGLPIVLFGTFIIALYLPFNFSELVLLYISSLLNYVINTAYILNDSLVRTDMKLLTQMVYSVLNSIFVPTMFIIFDSFSSILLTWNIAMIIAIAFSWRALSGIFKFPEINLQYALEVVKFGFPVYLSSLFVLIVQRIDTFILFLFFDSGETSSYFWVVKIATLGQEFFFSLFTGIFPLMTKIFSRGNMNYYYRIANSIIRIMYSLSAIFFGLLILESKLIIRIILSVDYLDSNSIIRIALLGYGLGVGALALNVSFSSEGNISVKSWGTVISNLSRLILIGLLISYGAMGFVIALASQRIVVTVYYLIMRRKEFDQYNVYLRTILFMTIFYSIALLLPSSTAIISSLISGLVFTILSIIGFYLLKPISSSDFDLIRRIVGNKFESIQHFINKHFVYQLN